MSSEKIDKVRDVCTEIERLFQSKETSMHEDFAPHLNSLFQAVWDCRSDLGWRLDYIMGPCLQILEMDSSQLWMERNEVLPLISTIQIFADSDHRQARGVFQLDEPSDVVIRRLRGEIKNA